MLPDIFSLIEQLKTKNTSKTPGNVMEELIRLKISKSFG